MLHSIDQKTQRSDVRAERIAAGTIGGDHVMSSTVTGKNASGVITPFDSRITLGGSWNLSLNNDFNNFLGYRARSSTVGSNINLVFNSTSVAVIGNTGPNYGRYDVYIDGVLAYGQVNTTTSLAASYYTTGGLNARDTIVTCIDASSFSSTGVITIDQEEISYTGTTAGTFTGCTRGANGTTATTHQAGVTIFGSSTNVEGYSAYYQDRVVMWRKTNLSPGVHKISLVIRADKNASSGQYDIDIGGFIVGGTLGAQNIITKVNYVSPFTLTTDAAGVTSPFAILPPDGSRQGLAVIGAYPIAGANWAYPMFKPSTGTYQVVTNALSSSVTIVLTTIELSQGF